MCVHAQSLSRVQLFVTLRTVAHQSPLTMEFSWEEHWSGLPFHPPGDFPDPGIEPMSPALAGRFLTAEPPRKPLRNQDLALNVVIATTLSMLTAT